MDASRLESIELFAQLTSEERDRVAEVCEELDVATGETVLREGDFGYSMFAITSGTADVIHDGDVVASLSPGDVFGEIAVLSGGRRVASVVATSALRLVAILNRDLWRLERTSPDVAEALRAKIEARVAELGIVRERA
jgi:CRP-like cAMP-binding protein